MPSRRGNRAIAGAFSGLSNVFGDIYERRLARRTKEEDATRQDKLQRARTAEENVTSGKWTEAQAAAYMNGEAVAPTVEQNVSEKLDEITKAPSPEQVPTRQAIGAFATKEGIDAAQPSPAGKMLPFGQMVTQPRVSTDDGMGNQEGGSQLPSTPLGPVSRNVEKILSGRNAKLDAFPPTDKATTMEGEGPQRHQVTTPMKYSVDAGQMLPLAPYASGPTAQESGEFKQGELMAGELSEPVMTARVKQTGLESGARTKGQIQAEVAQSGLSSQQQSAALALSDDFNRESGPFFTQQDSFRRMVQVSKTASPASDLAMVFSYMKVLDPGSTVREGEQASAQNATGVPDQIRNYYNRLMTGERLNPMQRQDFLRNAASMFQGAATEHQRRIDTFTERANGMRVPPSFVVRQVAPDLAGAADETDPAAVRRKLLERQGGQR